MNKSVKNMFSERTRVVSPKGKTKAQQQFKDDADINSIMRKFQKTGAIEHVAVHKPNYDIGPTDLHQAMNLVTKANSMFEELPSSLRERFANPTGFLEFVQNPDNEREAAELGLALSSEAQVEADAKPPEPMTAPEPEPEPEPA